VVVVAVVDEVVGGGVVVDEGVVVPAEQGEPVEAGAAAVAGPEVEVVNLTRPRWGGAAVEAAAAVAVDHRPRLGPAGGTGAPPQIQRHGMGGGEQPDEAGVTGQPSSHLPQHRAPESNRAVPPVSAASVSTSTVTTTVGRPIRVAGTGAVVELPPIHGP